ncbi:MAG TPA: ABC transporter ATP-binding protein/permease [[Clostridium] spiroforme]|uniref:ABC transporter ATP-binding protein/permease n=1 Tax=Thomasclavelia spiroformis TaxID=29348 RepID=A0A921KJS1_9FIRM|nr:ABC transporter ATP-binding protein/permease [Thomasclavelia spiroformis]
MLKKLSKSVREYKWAAFITPVFVTLEVIMEVVIPLLMANLIDDGVYMGEMNAALKIGVELIIAAVLSLIFGCLSGITASKASAGFAKNLRKDLYYKVQDFSFANIDKFSTASLVTRLTTDVSNVQQAFQMLTRITVRAPLMLVISVIMAININAELSMVLLIIVPIIAITLFFILRYVHPLMEKVFRKYDDLNEVVEENVSGIRVVKSFVIEEKEKKKFGKVSSDIYNTFSKAEKIMAFTMPTMQFAIYLCIILISWFGANIIVNTGMTDLTTGQLMTFITYSIQILSSLMMISMVIMMLTIARASAERIYEVLIEEPNIKDKENPVTEVKNGDIEFNNVSFSYVDDKEKECLKDINLKIGSGQTIGIIGGTGSGKSSLVNLIPRLYDVTEGSVKVGDVDVRDYDLKALRDQVSCVLQKNVLFSGTITENIKWGDENATDEDVQRVCKLAQADEFIQGFPDKYNTYIEQGGTNVSGGQKQRLCIARALLKKPKILILDDSTSAVDTKTDSLIRKAFREEIPDTTKIIIAQRISSVEDADKIIVIDDGKINGFGTHEELLKNNAIYKEVYDSQMKGSDTDA